MCWDEMEPLVNFVIPFWGEEPHRQCNLIYVKDFLQEHYSGYGWKITMGRGARPNNQSDARNSLVDADSDILVFLNADTVPDPAAVIDSMSHVLATKGWLLPYKRYYNLTEEGTKDFMENPPWMEWRPEDSYDYEYRFPGTDPVAQPPAVCGCVIVHREAWNKVRGYDPRFVGWGGEDRAFVYALETLVEPEYRYPAAIYHLWHPAPISETFNSPDWQENAILMQRYAEARLYTTKMTDLVNEW